MKAELLRRDVLQRGMFLQLERLEFSDEKKRIRHWEGASRVGGRGAVGIVAIVRPAGELILVRQFRPPAGRYLIELPAGLIDPGETPETTAERELLEETGYRGRVLAVENPGYSSPGMSGETITLVRMEVDGADYPVPPVATPEDTEHIECFRVPLYGLRAFLDAACRNGDGVDAKLQSIALFL